MFYRPEITVYECEACGHQIIVGYGEQPPDECPECGHDETKTIEEAHHGKTE